MSMKSIEIMSSHSQIASPSSPSQETKLTDEQREKNDEHERNIIGQLAEAALSGNWSAVLFMYQTHGALAHTAGLNKTGDTALRIAISGCKTGIAKQLVDEADKTPGVLERTNERGVTVLHVAAYLGKTDLCHHIARKKPALMGSRNNVKETPLFLAAHFGHLEAFLSLYKLLANKDLGYIYGRRGDGETILHTAIYRRYYEMAYHIIQLYPKFVYAMNEKGFSPLYRMASTPSAFKSGCPQIRGIRQFAYHLIHVSKLKLRAGIDIKDEKEHQQKQQTCISSPWHRIIAFMGCSKNQRDQSKDEEGQPEIGGDQGSGISQNGSQVPNKMVSIIGPSLQCLIHAMVVIFGPGTYLPKKLKETKQNNVWSEQIMKELANKIGGNVEFKYEHNGMSPDLKPDEEKLLVDNIPIAEDIPITLSDDSVVIYPIKTEVGKDIAIEKTDTNRNKEEMKNSNEAEAQKGGNNEAEAPKRGKVDIINSDQDQQLTVKEDISKDIISFFDQIRKDIIAITGDTNRNKEEMEKKNEAEAEAEAQRQEREALKGIAKKETPILVAARNGVIEILKAVLEHEKFKLAINDSNTDNKNVVLLAAENRRADVYDYLLKTKHMKERIFGQTDNDGNSALHLAATLKDDAEPWPVPGPALQMQCEVKWYEFVKDSMGPHFFQWYNKKEETPEDLLKTSHTKIVKEGGEWLNKTSGSFTIVATLIATVAFATSAIVPGGVDDDGNPNLENRPAFSIFAISSLVALCFSIICVMMFLAILTSSYKDVDFGKDLPRKFLIGLTSMFVSITSMLISFCAGHSFVIKEELKYAALPVYALTCLAVTVVTIAQFPFYFDLVMITFSKKPWSRKYT